MPANLVERLRYRVNNPSAWDSFDQSASDDFAEAAAEIERLEAERDEATVYARNFLVSFVNRHCDPVAEWAPLPDLIGMLTQIDNAATIAGIFSNRAQNAEAQRDKLAALVEQAFRDGLIYASNVVVNDPDLAWQHSRAREALEQVGKR